MCEISDSKSDTHDMIIYFRFHLSRDMYIVPDSLFICIYSRHGLNYMIMSLLRSIACAVAYLCAT